MSILGYDVNGRPLRAGDRVVPTETLPSFAPPGPWTVAGPDLHVTGAVRLEERDMDGDEFCALTCGLRRLDDRTEHQPSEYTFDSLMGHLKSGVPA